MPERVRFTPGSGLWSASGDVCFGPKADNHEGGPKSERPPRDGLSEIRFVFNKRDDAKLRRFTEYRISGLHEFFRLPCAKWLAQARRHSRPCDPLL